MKHANSRALRRQHIPIHPSLPNHDLGGVVLEIEGEPLDKRSYVKVENVRKCNIQSLCRYGGRKLSSRSLKTLMKYAPPGFTMGTAPDRTLPQHRPSHSANSAVALQANNLGDHRQNLYIPRPSSPYSYTFGGSNSPNPQRYGTFIDETPSPRPHSKSWLWKTLASLPLLRISKIVLQLSIMVAVLYAAAAGTRYVVLGLLSWIKSLGMGLKTRAVEIVHTVLIALKSWVAKIIGSMTWFS